MSKLAGKYAIVTGAGKGIGEAIVRRFLEDGAEGVAIFERDTALLGSMAEKFAPFGSKILGIACDVADRKQVKEAIDQTIREFGKIHILVNNAGITRDSIFHKMRDEDWDAVLTVNLTSMYNLCRQVVPLMREQEYGKIINLASTSAFGNAGQANYAASKAGAIGLTTTLARECGAKNITANCIAPGYIQTEMLDAVPEQVREGYRKQIPMRRFGQPSEVAAVASFLASDDSSFLSGQCLVVNGALQI